MSPMQVEEIVVRCRQLDVVRRQQLVHFFHPFLVRLALEMLLDSFWAVYDVYLAHRAIRSRQALCQNTLRLAVELFNRTPGLGLFHRRLCQGLGVVPALGTRCEAGSGDHEGGCIALVIRRYIMCVMFVCVITICCGRRDIRRVARHQLVHHIDSVQVCSGVACAGVNRRALCGRVGVRRTGVAGLGSCSKLVLPSKTGITGPSVGSRPAGIACAV